MADEPKERKLSRRDLLSIPAEPGAARMMAGLVGAVTGVGAALARATLGRKAPPASRDAFGQKIVAGKASDFQVGDVVYFNTGRFYLSRVPEGFLALYRRCPHQGCIVPWREEEEGLDPQFALQWPDAPAQGRFNCLCHGSVFDRYGVARGGPARRPLDLMRVEILPDGTIVVDTGEIRERVGYDCSQVAAVPEGLEPVGKPLLQREVSPDPLEDSPPIIPRPFQTA